MYFNWINQISKKKINKNLLVKLDFLNKETFKGSYLYDVTLKDEYIDVKIL